MQPSALSIAKSIVLPGPADPVRVNEGFNATKTSAANPFIDLALPFAVTGSTSFATMMLFRDPMRNLVFWDPNASDSDANYVTSFGDNNWDNPTIITKGSRAPFAPTRWDVDTSVLSYKPHGDVLYCACEGDKQFFWLNAENSVTFTLNDVGAILVNTTYCNVYYWDGDNANNIWKGGILIPATAASGSFTLTSSDIGNTNSYGGLYAAFEFYTLDTATAQVQIVSATISNFTDSGVWCHRSLPDFDNNVSQTKSLRIVGIGGTVRNTTAQQYLNGQAYIKMMPRGTDPQDILGFPASVSTSSSISSQQNSVVQSFKQSFYTFLPPLQVEDLDFNITDTSATLTVTTATKSYRLKAKRSWMLVQVIVAAPDVGVPGTNAQLRLEESIEFCSNNNWLAVRNADSSEKDVDAACRAVAKLPFVFSDPAASLPSDVHNMLLK